jgi:ribonucleoside-diphosphate reductase alpha chain
MGTVHSSNLCTEITLNTSTDEIAVCNLGSVNLVAHLGENGLDFDKVKTTVRTAMRMLDNVIDINYYAVAKARNSNLRHRPVGLGIMGFQDCLHQLRIPYSSQAAVEFADTSMEQVAYASYWASTELAESAAATPRFADLCGTATSCRRTRSTCLQEQRGGHVEVDRSATLDWTALRERIRQYGMRNSNCLAIAPTATIANIVGVSASIEPTYQNLYVKSNLSGEFTVVNDYLVGDLKKAGLWDEVMIADLKYFDGNLARIDRVPADLRRLYATAFEIEPKWFVEAAARRQKWIDQSQSLNIYIAGASGRTLDETYRLAWVRGLKTTYYLRSLGATHAEKSTSRAGQLNAVPTAESAASATAGDAKFCAIDNPDCEACQ